MAIFLSIIVFLFGLAVGSFLNCVIYRLALPNFSLKNLGGLNGRSFCPKCKHVLNFKDLIPVLSFIILKAKCRYCQKKISWQYPLVEIVTGVLFVLCFSYQLSYFLFLILPFLIVIFVYDLKYYLILDKVIYPAIVLTIVYDLWKSDFLLSIFGKSDFLISAIGAAAFFGLIVFVSRGRWMGIGDIKLGFLMGLLLGWPGVAAALFLAFMSGAIIGIGLIVASKKTLKSEVPFGPFLVAGTLVALFWGEQIINWYLSYV